MEESRKNSLDLAVTWLLKSIDPSTGGSRANYSILFNGLKGWSGPYPETTGYIIPTFINLSKAFDEYKHLEEKARLMGEWLLKIQFDDGAFPANIYYAGKPLDKSIFNTGQIILGLTALYDLTLDLRYLQSSERAALWLAGNQEADGSWQKFNYVKGFSPSYYSRVAWPILKVYKRSGNEKLKNSGVAALEYIRQRQLKNSFIDGSGFKPGSYVFLHTLAYTIRGFLESAMVLDDKKFWDAGAAFAERLMRHFEIHGEFYGAYYPDFSGIKWYQCLTGNMQIAIIWLKIFHQTKDLRFLNAASKAIDSVDGKQVKNSWNKNVVGAVAGSSPVYGRYMFFRYPNWAVKFFCDALLLESQALDSLHAG